MKTLTAITATSTDTTEIPVRPIVSSLHIEPVPGFFIKGTLGADGLVIRRGESAVLWPLAEILRVSQEIEPALVAPRLMIEPEAATAGVAATKARQIAGIKAKK